MTRKTRNTTKAEDDSGIISKVKQVLFSDKTRQTGRTLGILGVVAMLFLAPILFGMAGLIGTVAASDGGTIYDTSSEFDAQQVDGMDADTTNDMISLDGTVTSGSDSYYVGSVSSHDTVDVDVASVSANVDLVAVDGSGTVVDSQTVSASGVYTLSGSDIQEVEFRVLDTDGLAEINSFEVYDSVSTGAVDVTVEDQNGNAVESADVELYDLAEGAVVDTLTTDANGQVSFTGVEQGKDYDVDVSPPAGYDSALKTITHDSDPTTVTVTTSQTMGDIEGQVTDSDTGNVVENYTVNLLDGSGTVVESSTTDSNGQYYFADYQDGDTYTVEFADGSTYESQTQEVTIVGGENQVVDAALVPATTDTGSIQVEVMDGDTAVEGATVSIVDSTETEVTLGETDADGLFTASELEIGDYDVEVTHDETTHTQTLTVENGVTTTGTYDLTTTGGDGWFTVPGVSDDNKQMAGFVAALIVIVGTLVAIARD